MSETQGSSRSGPPGRRWRDGAPAGAVEEVLRYCETRFRTPRVPPPVLPLADEPHVADWRRYLLEAGDHPFDALQERLPQLAIPVGTGVSKAPAYRDVTRRGAAFSSADFGGRLRLDEPRALQVTIESHPAGALPVLSTSNRRVDLRGGRGRGDR
ncbi:MAG: hypothetical protein HY900_18330, partial [Deltaproteobacteria bacterium]|nr:hypothetical protein [Deltaproteobacteria bacterium]